MQIIIIPLIAIANMIIGITIGIKLERIEWNKLIEKGILPNPNREK